VGSRIENDRFALYPSIPTLVPHPSSVTSSSSPPTAPNLSSAPPLPPKPYPRRPSVLWPPPPVADLQPPACRAAATGARGHPSAGPQGQRSHPSAGLHGPVATQAAGQGLSRPPKRRAAAPVDRIDCFKTIVSH
jgi:hypothetical protein